MSARTQFWFRSLLGVGAVVALAVVLFRQSSIARLQDERTVLAADQDEAARLAKENGDLQAMRGDSDEVVRLREENKDLPRLRNEVRQLRRRLDEMNALKAENARLRAQQAGVGAGRAKARPPGYIPRRQFYDAGLATPEAALQTALWAWSTGNFDRMAQSMTPEDSEKFKKDLENEREELTKFGAALPGYLVLQTNTVSADEIDFSVQLLSDDTEPAKMRVRRVGNEWRVAPN